LTGPTSTYQSRPELDHDSVHKVLQNH